MTSYQLIQTNDTWLIESDNGYKLNSQDHKTFHKVVFGYYDHFFCNAQLFHAVCSNLLNEG